MQQVRVPRDLNAVFNALLLTLFFMFVVWYVQYHWKRRRLYYWASKRPGPPTYPLVGNGFYFSGSNSDTFYNALTLLTTYKSPVRVWLGSRLFFGVCGAKDLETVMNSPHALKKEELYKYAEPVVGTGLFTASVSKWKRHRKIIMPTFNQKILDDFVPIFVEQSDVLVKQLAKLVGRGEFDAFHYVSRCTLDIICETAMGITVRAQTTDSDYVKWANKAMEIAFMRMFNVWYHFDFVFNLTRHAKEFEDVSMKMHDFTGRVVRERREAYQRKLRAPEVYVDEVPALRKSFLQQLIELSENGAKFTDEELREEVDTFMVAGSDTTASMNSFIFIMLGLFPDIQEKLYTEVIDVLGPDRSVQHTDLNSFPYMERVMKETMRLFPVGPLLVRAVTQDIKLENSMIPKNSSVVLGIIAMHLDPNTWPNPYRFDPDRFLPEEVAKRHPYAWLPFSGGPRNCVGPKYAFMAMKTLIATVVRKYKFSTSYKCVQDIKLKADLMLKPVDGYKVSIEFRN